MRPRLVRTAWLRPQLGWAEGRRTRRVWGTTRLELSSGRLVLKRWPLPVVIFDLDRRRILDVRVAGEGLVEVSYEQVGRPWAGLVDQDREVSEHTLWLYLDDDAQRWSAELGR